MPGKGKKKDKGVVLKTTTPTAEVSPEPTPTVEPEPPVAVPPVAEAAPVAPPVAPSKHRGQGLVAGYGSLRIMEFQNRTLRDNAEWKLSDEQLAALWRHEFPHADGKVFSPAPGVGASIVRGVRALYNKGRHAQESVPDVVSVAYDSAGNRVTARGKSIAS